VDTNEISFIKLFESQEHFPPYHEKIETFKKLKGLDLFCGGGSLGRGVEDSGFVSCKWQVYYIVIKIYILIPSKL